MSDFASFIPAPVQQEEYYEDEQKPATTSLATLASFEPPPYGHRKGFIPRMERDFGDGGAFPEIIMVQYPLGMGKKKNAKSNALALQVDKKGNIKYDAIVKQGHYEGRVVHSKFDQLVPKVMPDDDDPSLMRPDEESIKEQTEKTRMALEKLTRDKISAAMPVKAAEQRAPAQYIRYTPSQQGNMYNSGAKQRVIRIMEVQKDPMEPPKFRTNKKLPQGPPSPPPPIIHSPNRKVTVKEQQDWKIPPSISNWKNAKGHTIPLDKRLAADGRGLQSVHINENFAKLAEALFIADRKAREAVDMRAAVERNVAQKEKEQKEKQLRQLAEESRNRRAGRGRNDDDDEVRERDAIRRDRERERARRRGIERAAPDKKYRLQQQERDISEKIALGMPNARRGAANDTQYDQRLFNRNSGMDSGFQGGHDESYAVYDKPWRKDSGVGNSIYRPRDKQQEQYNDDEVEDMKRARKFVPEKPFKGAEGSSRRDGPVEFERNNQTEDDPFQLDQFMKDARHGKRGGDRDHQRDDKKRRK